MNLILYTAIYTKNANGKCQQAGASFHVKYDAKKAIHSRITSEQTYGEIWLEILLKILRLADSDELSRQHIKLICGQPITEKMAGKFDRILCQALRLKQPLTEMDIAKLVHKDGRYTKRPNDELYTAIIFKLWQMQTQRRIYFEFHMMPCNKTMSLVKDLHDKISPQKRLFKKKPKKVVDSKAEAPL